MQEDDDHIFHKALSVAIKDAMNFIRQVEAMGWFDDDEVIGRKKIMSMKI